MSYTVLDLELNQEHYDPQCKIPPYHCVFCGCDSYEATELRNGDEVCVDCMSDYLQSKVTDEYVEEFIDRYEEEYYFDWFFGGMEPSEKLDALKEVYKKRLDKDEEAEDKLYFCKEHLKFGEFIEGQLR